MKKFHLPQLNREKYCFRNIAPFLVAFLMPILVMTVVFIERGIYPFGERCFLRTDLYHQYAPFFQELRTKLTTGGSLFYSWNIGGGTNFWALSAYYLASPLNLFIVLCPKDFVIEFVTWQIVMKLGLCSLSVSFYLNKRHNLHGTQAYPAAFFGTFYALSGYMAAYQWNVMWLDCIWLFPLVIYSIERLVKENKGLLYSVLLGLTILSNYYIAIIVCMGIAVYCFFLLGTERKMLEDFGMKFMKFIGYTLLAVIFSFVFLIPYIAYFPMTASADSGFTWKWYQYFSVFEMLTRHLMNVQVHTGLDNWPNIYCGIAIFMLIPFYYLNKKITLREKIGYTIVLIFFYFSFSNRAMDYIWHVFHIPNSLPCRQAFIYIFILMVMSFRGFIGIEDRSYRDITFGMLFALVFIFAAEYLCEDEEIYTNYVFYISALFIILYTIVFYGFRKGKIYKDILIVILLALACVETTIDTSITSVPTVTRSDYNYIDDDLEIVNEQIAEKEGNNFYRMEKIDFRTKNDGAWLNFPSISTFSSCANSNLTDFYKKLGLEASFNAYGSMGQTFLTNMMMSVKYSISDKELDRNDDLYQLIYTDNKDIWVYENMYTLPVAYMVPENFANHWNLKLSNYLKVQNNFADEAAGVENLFIDMTPTYGKGTQMDLTIEEDGYYYLYPGSSAPSDITIVFNEKSERWENLNRGYTILLGYHREGDVITVKNSTENSSKNLDVKLYKIDLDALAKTYDALADEGLIIDTYTDTEITGHVTALEDGVLFTTVAAEPGWEVYVDGVQVEYYTIGDAYIALDLTAGEHNVSFKYHVPFFVLGLCCTIGVVIIWIAIFFIDKWQTKRLQEKLDRIAAAAASEEISEGTEQVAAESPVEGEVQREPY